VRASCATRAEAEMKKILMETHFWMVDDVCGGGGVLVFVLVVVVIGGEFVVVRVISLL